MDSGQKRSKNQWFPLSSGRVFDFSDPRPEMIHFPDIASSLAKIVRFNGHCCDFYSVAQHSCLVSEIIGTDEPHTRLHALLHDAHEAYIGDIISPLKRHLGSVNLKAVESRIDAVIFEAFGLEPPSLELRQRIKHADLVALATERRDLLDWPEETHFQLVEIEDVLPREKPIVAWDWMTADDLFTEKFQYWMRRYQSDDRSR